MPLYFYLTFFRSLRQKSKNKFVYFLVQIRTRKFASQNYIPLIKGKVKGCQKVKDMDSFPISVWLLSFSQAQTLAICIFLYFAKLCKLWARLEKLDFGQYAKRINIKFLAFQVKYLNKGHTKAKSLILCGSNSNPNPK